VKIDRERQQTSVDAARNQTLKSQETARAVGREDLSGACLALLEQGLRHALYADEAEHRDK
jgi:hypothetical protein